jgi:Fe2+ or Zn2+ uptake regulation protein
LINAEQKFEEFLKSKESKYTSERKSIVKAMFSFHKHFDVNRAIIYPELLYIGLSPYYSKVG